jgi:hypothetical protein
MLLLSAGLAFLGGVAGVFIGFKIFGQERILESESSVVWAFTIGFALVLTLALRLLRPKHGFAPVPESSPAAPPVPAPYRAGGGGMMLAAAGLLVVVGAFISWDFHAWEQTGGSRSIDARVAWLYLLFGKWGVAAPFWLGAVGLLYARRRDRERSHE